MIGQKTRKIIFFIFLIIIGLFYVWSKILWVTLIMLLVLDSFTLKKGVVFFKYIFPHKTYQVIKYSYYLILPIILAIFIRTFFFDIYFVPSSSMERTLFPNDYVLVNKIKYGTKIPKRIQDIPVIGMFLKKEGSEHKYDLYSTLKPLHEFNREDIVVFKSVEDNNTFLIKRIIGVPNDTLKIVNSHVIINGNPLEEEKYYCYNYLVKKDKQITLIETYSNEEYQTLNVNEKSQLKKDIRKDSVMNFLIFPFLENKNWTRDNYGKIIIPKKGMKINLNNDNISIYRNLIKNYENTIISLSENESQEYTFKNNYYFMMGDNRHNSRDSRFFGFVPENYIQGKMISVFSKNRLLN